MSRTLTIFHVTDVHARVGVTPKVLPGLEHLVRPDRPGRELFAGLAGVDALLQEEMARLPDDSASMLVCCGDLVGQEVATDRQTRGAITFQAMQQLALRSGVDAAVLVVGNHEMDHGVDRATELLGGAHPFVVVAGNLGVDGEPASAPIVDLDVQGLRVGVLGLTTPQTAKDAPAHDRPRLATVDPVDAARAALAADETDRDVLLAAVHLFDPQDQRVCGLDGVDLLIGGHTHALLSGPLGTRAISREKAGAHGIALGRAVLRIDRGVARVVRSQTALLPPDVPPPADSPLLALHDAALAAAQQDPAAATAIARADRVIGSISDLRTGDPCALGRTVAQGLLEGAAELIDEPVHAAFVNAGNVRADIVPSRGLVSRAALHDVLAYANELVIVELDAAGLRRVLQTAVLNLKLDMAGWQHTAGLSFHVPADALIGPIHVAIPRGNKAPLHVPIEDLSVVRVATIDWLADGGHHLDVLTGAPQRRTGVKAADAWADALVARSLGAQPAALTAPPPTTSVDAGFRCTDTQTVLNALDPSQDALVTWALDLIAEDA